MYKVQILPKAEEDICANSAGGQDLADLVL